MTYYIKEYIKDSTLHVLGKPNKNKQTNKQQQQRLSITHLTTGGMGRMVWDQL